MQKGREDDDANAIRRRMETMMHGGSYLDAPRIAVDHARCTGCGTCEAVCPMRIFMVVSGRSTVARDTDECCLCGQCLAACPREAIEHSGFDLSTFARVPGSPVSPEIALDLLSRRRSVRVYQDRLPPRELVERIVDVASYAPGSPHHRVGWVREFSVVHGRDGMRAVVEMTAEYLRETARLIRGPVVRLAARFDPSARAAQEVLPDIEMRLRELEEGRDAIAYGAPMAVFAHAPVASSMPHSDCCIALSYVQLYASACGIGTCWNGLLQMAAAGEHMHGFTKLGEFLGIPEGSRCYAAMTAGYPAVRLHSIPRRRVGITWAGGG